MPKKDDEQQQQMPAHDEDADPKADAPKDDAKAKEDAKQPEHSEEDLTRCETCMLPKMNCRCDENRQ